MRMATSDRGEFPEFAVVVVPFPYADRLSEKRRPAVVVSNGDLAAFGVLWVAMITSAENEPWPCDVPITDLAAAGLPAPSVVRPAKIATIEPSRVVRQAGVLDEQTARRVARRVRGLVAAMPHQ